MRPACFFDRDGVIIEEADYIHDPSLVKLCPFAADAIRAMLEHDGPYLLDVHIGYRDQVLPMIPPGGCAADIITE